MPSTPAAAGTPPPPSRLRLLGRGVVVLLVVAFLLSGLVLRQGMGRKQLGGHSLHSLPQWIMFSNVGLGLTQVRYLAMPPGQKWREVDRYAVLGLQFRDQPPGVWRVHGLTDARKLGKRLCAELPPGTQLRLRARTATRKGWRIERGHKVDLCTWTPDQGGQKKKGKKK